MERKRIITILSASILLGLIFGPPGAQGALIKIEIEAVVDSVLDDGNYLEGRIGLGDIITGFYTYESTTPDSNPLEKGGRYEHTTAPHGIFLSVGGFDFETNPGVYDKKVALLGKIGYLLF